MSVFAELPMQLIKRVAYKLNGFGPRPNRPRPHLATFNRAVFHRSLYLQGLYSSIESIPGSIVECGVGQGQGTALWISLALLEGKNRRVWAFDSFEGFPALAAEDEATDAFEEGLQEYRQFDIPYVRQTLIDFGIASADIDRSASFVKGFIPDSCDKYDGSEIALLYIDLDIFEGYRDALLYFFDKVSPNGVIAFDEYLKPLDTHKWPVAVKAINEFLDARGLRNHLQVCPLTGNRYLIKT